MSMLDGILKNIGGAPDDVANLAAKVGIDPGMAEKAIAVLGKTHQMDGDTVELASAKTGLDTGVLNQIVEQIGGEGSLSSFASMLDRDGDGGVMDDITDIASGLFGKK
jgi:ATP phosphoribosyltransferase regulatory subunit HisZ